jgi:hypothetical protein
MEIAPDKGERLPNAAKPVSVEKLLFTDDGKIFGLGLGDEHAIEGITVGARKETGAESVLDRDGKQLKALTIEITCEVCGQACCRGKLA